MKNSKKIGRDKSRTHDLSHAKERATNYATRPFSSLKFLGILSRLIWIAFSISKLIFEFIDIILTILSRSWYALLN